MRKKAEKVLKESGIVTWVKRVEKIIKEVEELKRK